MRASAREGASRALLVAMSVALTLAGLEGAARVARRFRGAGYEAGEEARYTEYDPLLGWRNRPDTAVTYHRREYTVEIAINHLGLRDVDHDYAPPAGVCRILALGDSFVEGYTVPLAQTVGRVLESSLRRDGRRAEVLNAGTSGYSTDQEYLFYLSEGARYAPRVVLLFFYYNDVLYNDRDRFAAQPKPLFVDHDGRLELTRTPVPPPPPPEGPRHRPAPSGSAALEWLHDRLLYGAPRAEEALGRLHLWDPIARARAPLEIRVYDRRPPGDIDEAWTKTEDLLAALAREVAARGARLLVVYVPNRFEVDPRSWELTRITYGVDDNRWDRGAVCRHLLRIGGRRGFPVLDLTEPLEHEVHWWSGPYFDYDGHWTAVGHRVAADALRQFLEGANWVPVG